jgi:hypothetical protein
MPWGQGQGFRCRNADNQRGNRRATCRLHPSLPRRWRASLHGNDSAAVAGANGGASVEIGFLKKEAAFLRQQLKAIEKRLHELLDEKNKPAEEGE